MSFSNILQRSALIIGAAILLSIGSIAAQAEICGDELLAGDYSYQVYGQDGTTAPFLPFVSERLVTFDGKGNLSGNGYRVLAGSSAPSLVTGTYSVHSNCSVSFSIKVLGNNSSISDRDQSFGVVTESGAKVGGIVVSSLIPGTNKFEFEKSAR